MRRGVVVGFGGVGHSSFGEGHKITAHFKGKGENTKPLEEKGHKINYHFLVNDPHTHNPIL